MASTTTGGAGSRRSSGCRRRCCRLRLFPVSCVLGRESGGRWRHHLQLRFGHHPVVAHTCVHRSRSPRALRTPRSRCRKSGSGSCVARSETHAMSSIGSPRCASSQSTIGTTRPSVHEVAGSGVALHKHYRPVVRRDVATQPVEGEGERWGRCSPPGAVSSHRGSSSVELVTEPRSGTVGAGERGKVEVGGLQAMQRRQPGLMKSCAVRVCSPASVMRENQFSPSSRTESMAWCTG